MNLFYIMCMVGIAVTQAYSKGVGIEVPWMPLLSSVGLLVYAHLYKERDHYIYRTMTAIAVMVLFCTAFALATDAVAYGCQLHDGAFRQADAKLGLNAVGFKNFVLSHRWLEKLGYLAYFSMIPQLMLAMMNYNSWTTLKRMMAGAFATLVVFMLLPALGNYSDHTPQDFNKPVKQHMLDLSTMQVDAIRIDDCEGIICAPSYHTIMGCILIAAFWNRPIVRTWAIVLNVLMIASTVPMGGHYFIDILGGLIVGALVVFLIPEKYYAD